MLDEFDAWPEVVRREASDLHIKVGTPPKIRDAGALIPLDHAPIGNDEATTIVEAIVPPERRERLETSGEIDFAYSLAGVGRFRVNEFRQRGSYSAVLRKLRFGGSGSTRWGCPT